MNQTQVRNSFYQRYLFLFLSWCWLISPTVTTTHSLGFTNIFSVIHHKTDEEAKQLNDFLEELEEEEMLYNPPSEQRPVHLAWFPPLQRAVIQDVVMMAATSSDKGTTVAENNNNNNNHKKKKTRTTTRSAAFHALAEEEFMERLIQLQD
jgi:hypothetical protein